MTNFDDVRKFHEKFNLPTQNPNEDPHALDDHASEYRIKFLHEELDEYEAAVKAGDLEGQFDALLDLVYIAMGTAHMQNFPWEAGWSEVQRANITKVRAKADGSDSKRGSALDVVKPEGWTPPRIMAVLESYGYNSPQMGC